MHDSDSRTFSVRAATIDDNTRLERRAVVGQRYIRVRRADRVHLWQRLGGDHADPEHALSCLDSVFVPRSLRLQPCMTQIPRTSSARAATMIDDNTQQTKPHLPQQTPESLQRLPKQRAALVMYGCVSI